MENISFSFRYNPVASGLERVLGPLESQVMTAIWDSKKPEVTVSDVYHALRNHRDLAYTTVKTTFKRLVTKGLLVQKPTYRLTAAQIFFPVYSREAFRATVVRHIMESLMIEERELVLQYVDELIGIEALRQRQRGST